MPSGGLLCRAGISRDYSSSVVGSDGSTPKASHTTWFTRYLIMTQGLVAPGLPSIRFQQPLIIGLVVPIERGDPSKRKLSRPGPVVDFPLQVHLIEVLLRLPPQRIKGDKQT